MKRSTRSSEGPQMNTDRRVPVFRSLSGFFSGSVDVFRPQLVAEQLTVYWFGPTKESSKNFGFNPDSQRQSLFIGAGSGLDVGPSVQSSQLMSVFKERQQMDTPTSQRSPLCSPTLDLYPFLLHL